MIASHERRMSVGSAAPETAAAENLSFMMRRILTKQIPMVRPKVICAQMKRTAATSMSGDESCLTPVVIWMAPTQMRLHNSATYSQMLRKACLYL